MKLNTVAVREFQIDRGLNDGQLAEKAGLSKSYLSELLAERKPKTGTPKTWKQIADALGVHVRAIIEPNCVDTEQAS